MGDGSYAVLTVPCQNWELQCSEALQVGVASHESCSGKLRGQCIIWGCRADLHAVLYMVSLSAVSQAQPHYSWFLQTYMSR
jgi:hypothetical protein